MHSVDRCPVAQATAILVVTHSLSVSWHASPLQPQNETNVNLSQQNCRCEVRTVHSSVCVAYETDLSGSHMQDGRHVTWHVTLECKSLDANLQYNKQVTVREKWTRSVRVRAQKQRLLPTGRDLVIRLDRYDAPTIDINVGNTRWDHTLVWLPSVEDMDGSLFFSRPSFAPTKSTARSTACVPVARRLSQNTVYMCRKSAVPRLSNTIIGYIWIPFTGPCVTLGKDPPLSFLSFFFFF